jgi:hypothetical protein
MVSLPNTSPQNRRHHTHVKLLESVRLDAWNGAGFDGQIYPCGAQLTAETLGDRPVLVECAGPIGTWRNGKPRETLWILWRYDWAANDWREIARAQAFDWSWAIILREPAIRALQPITPALVDPAARGREVTDDLLEHIDKALLSELPAVRSVVLTSIYDRVAGRIVAA